jgi:hypothetical protein
MWRGRLSVKGTEETCRAMIATPNNLIKGGGGGRVGVGCRTGVVAVVLYRKTCPTGGRRKEKITLK